MGMNKEASITIRTAGEQDIALLQRLAEESWWPTYSTLISKEQIEYMLQALYSTDVLSRLMRTSEQEFLILYEGLEPCAFAAYSFVEREEASVKINKLYVVPSAHKKGYGKILLNEVMRKVRSHNVRFIELKVNRSNPARYFYERMGFAVLREEDVEIGTYWMNDYVMQYELRDLE